MPPLEVDLERVAASAAQRRDDNEAFGYYVDTLCERGDWTDEALDARVDAIAAEVAAQIDCTACGNCCRSLTVGLTPDDIPALAGALGQPGDAVIAQYVDREMARREGEWGVFRHQPCALLVGKRCSIYASRPAACRAYPAFTPDFRYLAQPIIAGAGLCPIIYNVIERLKIDLGW
ncbi:YkgJ family cysteine cluster protein [Aggregatilinea lenta]|uniref:YkgJ family cysteine cluster protein n=1 Tax=Aggregatilinea lenta TaxID=913108 RepID=UPI0013C2F8E4|nr:YkgJ family cysteine cluster protein [Aggregatilinea lenta]